MKNITTLKSEVIYQNPWIKLRVDEVRQEGVSDRPYSVIEFKGGVGIVAIDSQNRFLLVGQYRYPTDTYSWEIPKGAFPTFDSHVMPIVVAKNELKEETGLINGIWQELGHVHTLLGSTNDKVYLFSATNLKLGEAQPDETEDIETKWVSEEDFWKMVMGNQITDATSIAAVGMFRRGRVENYPKE